jgi:hypothetical protein
MILAVWMSTIDSIKVAAPIASKKTSMAIAIIRIEKNAFENFSMKEQICLCKNTH